MTNTPDAQQLASFAEKGGAAVAVVSAGIRYFGLTKDEWTLIFAGIGAAVAVAGLAVSWYFQWKRDRREARLMGWKP